MNQTMMLYIGITDIIPNAFIHIMQRSKDYRPGDRLEIEVELLYKYAQHVADIVKASEGKDNVKLTYIKEDDEFFLNTFGNIFYKAERDGVAYIGVYPEVSEFGLREQFRSGLNISLAKALSNKSALADLGLKE